jgi:hypothetical protein
MHESDSDRPVTVTAQERAHPAILKLARACIAIARQLAGSPSPEAEPLSEAPDSEQSAQQERNHD